jgi:hypothetical protein
VIQHRVLTNHQAVFQSFFLVSSSIGKAELVVVLSPHARRGFCLQRCSMLSPLFKFINSCCSPVSYLYDWCLEFCICFLYLIPSLVYLCLFHLVVIQSTFETFTDENTAICADVTKVTASKIFIISLLVSLSLHSLHYKRTVHVIKRCCIEGCCRKLPADNVNHGNERLLL